MSILRERWRWSFSEVLFDTEGRRDVVALKAPPGIEGAERARLAAQAPAMAAKLRELWVRMSYAGEKPSPGQKVGTLYGADLEAVTRMLELAGALDAGPGD
jgi:hypothetical protein